STSRSPTPATIPSSRPAPFSPAVAAMPACCGSGASPRPARPILCAMRADPMKSHREELWFETKTRRAFVNITPRVEAALKKSGIREGFCLVNAMHISASVFVNDDERGLHADFERWLEGLAPHEPTSQWRHNDTG